MRQALRHQSRLVGAKRPFKVPAYPKDADAARSAPAYNCHCNYNLQ